MKALLVVLLAVVSAGFVVAQPPNPTPVIAGLPVHCYDATGAVVFTIIGPIPDHDLAQSGIAPNGTRFIQLNPESFFRLPGMLQLFVYGHECGHHVSGDIVAGIYLHHDNPAREMNADRIGIRLMRDQLHITKDDATAISSFFVHNPPIPPYYLPGPQRARWIVDCYGSRNDGCNDSSADYGADAAQPDQAEPDHTREVERAKAACRAEFDRCMAKIMPASQCTENNVRACSISCNNPYRCDCSPQSFYGNCSELERDDRKSCRDRQKDCLDDAETEGSN